MRKLKDLRGRFNLVLMAFLLLSPTIGLSDTILFGVSEKNFNQLVSCTFMKIEGNKLECYDIAFSQTYYLQNLNSITVKLNGKTFVLDKIYPDKYEEIAKTINSLNDRKENARRAVKKRRIQHQEALHQKRKKHSRQGDKFLQCAQEFNLQCQIDCSINKHQYDSDCYNSCLVRYCVW